MQLFSPYERYPARDKSMVNRSWDRTSRENMCGVTPSGSSTFAAGFSRPRNVPLSSLEFHVPSFKSHSDEVLFLTGPTHHRRPTYSYWRRDRSTQKRLLLSFVFESRQPPTFRACGGRNAETLPPPAPSSAARHGRTLRYILAPSLPCS